MNLGQEYDQPKYYSNFTNVFIKASFYFSTVSEFSMFYVEHKFQNLR